MRRIVLIGALLSLPGFADAQSLGEIARQEQEKRKRTPGAPAPTYTEDDLRSRRVKRNGSVAEEVVSETPTPSAPVEPSPTPEPDRALLEREWRARFAEARARVAEADARAYEDRIETVFVSGIPVQQRVRVKVETPELREAKRALDDLEEELRRSGGLPGWARE